MINDVFGELRTRVLQHFPERQLYLRSGGEVKYYVFGTRTQTVSYTHLTLPTILLV